MEKNQREKYIRRALESAMGSLTEASSKLEDSFCEILPDAPEFPELEDLALSVKSLYLQSQDLISSFVKEIEKLKVPTKE